MERRSFSNYHEAMDFLFQAVNYEKLTRYKYDLPTFDLDRVRRLFAAFGRPHDAFRCVHVAGTKGKGSTSTMVAAILQAAGHRVGLFTSPHLVDLEERIVVDGQKISKADTVRLLSEVSGYVSQERRDNPALCPTFFEIVTAMGFIHFSQVGVDYAVVEVGLGGRLDSTNVISPEVCAITTIGFDHVKKLGHTLDMIAAEKAGIIKPGVPVVTAVDQPEALDVIAAKCREVGAQLHRVGDDIELTRVAALRQGDCVGLTAVVKTWRYPRLEITLPVLGRHQASNAAVALGVVSALEDSGSLPSLDPEVVRSALRTLQIPGRAQIVGQRPTVILDGAHTVASARALWQAIEESVPHDKLILIMGISSDKDVDGIMGEVLPHADTVFFCKSDSPRAVEPEELAQRAIERCGKAAKVEPVPKEALRAARAVASARDLICVTGSFYVAGKVREALDEAPAG